jgi:hypothetical protein
MKVRSGFVVQRHALSQKFLLAVSRSRRRLPPILVEILTCSGPAEDGVEAKVYDIRADRVMTKDNILS